MREVSVSEITKNIREMCIEANHFLSPDLSSDRFILFQHSLLCHKTATFMTFFIQL